MVGLSLWIDMGSKQIMVDSRDIAAESKKARSDAIEALYATFARYKLNGPVDGCPHCTSSEDDRLLNSDPLQKLPPANLERFAFKAVSTLGTLEDFKHFLPRILELAALGGNIGHTLFEIILGKLDYAGWTHWPQREGQAIRDYLSALWQHQLCHYPAPVDADDCLCGIGNCESDLRPYLQIWQRENGAASLNHLTDFIGHNARHLLKEKRLGNAFWEEREPQARQVIEWLLNAAMTKKLESAFFNCKDATLAEKLSTAADQLAWVHNRMA